MARSVTLTLPDFTDLRSAAADWARNEGVIWVYVFKTVLAALLTMWVAMRLELPQPSTAVTTVFVVMQPQSGQVFAKSFYRILGSIVGLSVVIALIAIFGQERVLFLLAASLWIGLCTAGSARYRDFRSYAFMLAGYTTALIGLPAALHPEATFMQAVWRFLEISLGILGASFVSGMILPQTSGAALRDAMNKRFGSFATFVLDHLGDHERQHFENAELRFAMHAVALETLRNATSFDDPRLRLRTGRLARLNVEFMTLTTRFHALHQLLERLRNQDGRAVLEAFEPCLNELREWLSPWRDKAMSVGDAQELADEFDERRQRLMETIRQTRGGLDSDETGQLDFDTAAELLYRLFIELNEYTRTHASLAARRHARENWKYSFETKANSVAALVAGMRSAVMMLAAGFFWIESAWASGNRFVTLTAVVATLVSAAANPARMAIQMAQGTVLAVLFGFGITFFVLPRIDGFPLLCLAVGPVFALGTYLTTRPKVAGIGSGLRIFFSSGTIPANLILFDPAATLNADIAMLLAMSLAAAATAVIFPPNAPWLWRRLEHDLRLRAVKAIRWHRSDGLAAAFESSTRDLLNQAHSLAASRPDVQRRLLSWTFVVLEIGHAVIEIRREQDALPAEPCYAWATPWREETRNLGRALIRLFVKPGEEKRLQALAAAEKAIATLHATEEPRPTHFESSPLRRIEGYLHLIRTTLFDLQPLLRKSENA